MATDNLDCRSCRYFVGCECFDGQLCDQYETMYDISKQKGGQYFAHPKAHPEQPIKGSFGEKKHAAKFAAKLMGMSVKEFLSERRKNNGETA